MRIIGAGPAGLVSAIVLRDHGHPVTVFERSGDVGHRLNGDFQGLENWSSDIDVTDTLKSLGIDINFLCEPYFGGVVFCRGMEPAMVKSEKPIFYLVKRGSTPGSFDVGLKEQALARGVEIRFNSRVDHLEGQAIVGTGPKGADIIAVGVTFDTNMEDTAAVVLDNDIAPGGYAYLLVNKGYGTMATVLCRDFSRREECFKKMLRFFHGNLELKIRNRRKFGGIGNFFLRNTQVQNEKLYIGETAGFQDCLWGFGMRYSVVSGYLAAKSIVDSSDYDVMWKRELGPMLETSLVNRYLITKFGHVAYRYLTRKLRDGDPVRFLKGHYNRSTTKRLLLPFARKSYVSRAEDDSCSHKNGTRAWCGSKPREG
jgi:flavin-dependent dehydrogenase